MSSPQPAGSRWIDYDYAIVRVVPKVHLGLFINIGVVVHARTAGYLDARFHIDPVAIARQAPLLDPALLARFANAYHRVCHGGAHGGPIGVLPISERFHWLTSPRSAVLQTSPVHPGRCHDPAGALEQLFAEHCLVESFLTVGREQ